MLQRLLRELRGIPECEVIVVDDASAETVALECAAMVAEHDNAELLRQPARRGAAAARNRGASVARGRYLWFVDDDDVLPHATLKEAIRRLVANEPQLALLSSTFVSENQRLGGYEPSPGRDRFERYRDVGQLVSLPCIIMQTELFRAVGGWDERFVAAQDTDLVLRLAAKVIPTCWPDLHVIIDVGDRPRLTTNVWRQQRAKIQILQKHWRRLSVRRLFYYVVSFALWLPLFKLLSGRRVAREILIGKREPR